MSVFVSNRTSFRSLVSVLIIMIFSFGCGGGGGNTSSSSPAEQVLEGKAQKGSFLKGARVTATQLNAFAENDSATVSSTVSDNLGSFNFKTRWKGWTELSVVGRFYDEYSGANSSTELELKNLTQIKSASQNINVNLFTHFIAARIRALVNSETTISQASDIAQLELKEQVQLLSLETSVEQLDLSDGEGDYKGDNAILLLFSGGFLASGGDATLLLALTDDFADNGKIDADGARFFEQIGNSAGRKNSIGRLSNNLKESGIQNPPNNSDLVVIPKWANQPPLAIILPVFKTIVEGQSITVSANLSVDPDGDQLSYRWSGNSTAACGDNSQCRFRGLSVGDHTIKVAVTDEHGSRSKTVTSVISVNDDNDDNEIPVANLSVSSANVSAGSTVGLDASRSYDEDGSDSDLTISWFGTGTGHCTNNTQCTLSNLREGIYQITVSVKDLDGGSDSTSKVITVSGNNIPPIANAGRDKTIFENESVNLSGTLSEDVDGRIVNYAWTEGSLRHGNEKTVTIRNLSVGSHTITLNVIDNDGAVSRDTVRVVVKENGSGDGSDNDSGNNTPTANAGSDKRITVGDSVTLSGSGSSDSDGSIVRYVWKKGSTVVGRSSRLVLSSLPVGEYRYFLTVTDNDGATSTDNVTVSVVASDGGDNDGGNEGPTANAGSDRTIILGAGVTLDASNSTDDDGNIETYQWEKGTTVVGRSRTLVQNSLPIGTHPYTLTVTDNDGAKSTDTVVITVRPATTTVVVNTSSTNRCTSLGMATYSFQGGETGTGQVSIQSYTGGADSCSGTRSGSPITSDLTYTLTNINYDDDPVIRARMTIMALGITRNRRVTITDGIVSF